MFHRDGEPIRDFRVAWEAACVAAGCYVVVPRLDAQGRPRVRLDATPIVVKKPTKLTGHKTESVYRRYAIVSEADLSEGVSKLAVGLPTLVRHAQ